MNEIILLKSRGYIDIIKSDYEISQDYITLEDIEGHVDKYNNCLLSITKIELEYDSGQMGDYGSWEIAPYSYIASCNVKKVCDISNCVTKSEKYSKYQRRNIKASNKLQVFVESFNTKDTKYYLSKVWQHDKLTFGEVKGETFLTYIPIHKFDNDSNTPPNRRAIKSWIEDYFKTLSINQNNKLIK